MPKVKIVRIGVPGPAGAELPTGGVRGQDLVMVGGVMSWRTRGYANLRDYRNLVDTNGYWDAAMIQAQADAYDIYVPDGTYKISAWIPLRSNRRWHGDGAASVIFNDKTNADVQRRACFLPGNHHPANMAAQTAYILNAIAAGDPTVTATTAADAANFTAGELVIVGSATNVSGVSRHAQLNKVESLSGGTITLVDPIAEAISDARIWKISGTDTGAGQPIYAVENVHIENLGFRGRSAIATKGAVFGGTFRNLHMLDTHHFLSTNMLTHVLIENLYGQWSGRYMEFAFNSHDVTARNWRGQFRGLTTLQTGEAQVLPIHLGEQPYRILLEDVFCHVDSRYGVNSELAQIKGSHIAVRRPNWQYAGAQGSNAVSIPDCAFTGFRHENVVFEGATLAAPGKVRIAHVGGATINPQNPLSIHFRGGELRRSVTGESIWFQAGRNLSCGMTDRTGKAVKVSTTAQYPLLNGYRRA